MPRETLVTEDGYNNLKEELERLTTVRRAEVAERIKQARDYGDISENAEYDDAKNEQARLEARIVEIEEKLRNAKIVAEVDSKTVGIGTKVGVEEKKSGEKMSLTIVGASEADPLNDKVSYESPIGKALMDRKRGEEVEVSLPKGTVKYKITSIRVAK
jgi:transcription elongation factor GreA